MLGILDCVTGARTLVIRRQIEAFQTAIKFTCPVRNWLTSKTPKLLPSKETKLKETRKIKAKGCNIARKDKHDKSGGFLDFLIRNINFASIKTCSTTDSDLELQDITVAWNEDDSIRGLKCETSNLGMTNP
ncbi:hypothetical protein TNCV_1488791 [Trichonephila clavipes]|nr:hypothetical protein TNCV_1488791 [Trichonephila clavipes]